MYCLVVRDRLKEAYTTVYIYRLYSEVYIFFFRLSLRTLRGVCYFLVCRRHGWKFWCAVIQRCVSALAVTFAVARTIHIIVCCCALSYQLRSNTGRKIVSPLLIGAIFLFKWIFMGRSTLCLRLGLYRGRLFTDSLRSSASGGPVPGASNMCGLSLERGGPGGVGPQ